MATLRIEHAVSDFERWKHAFDADPVGRVESGVRRYRILRAADNPNFVLVDLEFDTADEARALHARLLDLWSRVDVMRDAQARVCETVEITEY